jgi:hypothetical protein
MKIIEATRLLHPAVKLARMFRAMQVNTRITDGRWAVEYVERDGQHVFHYRICEGDTPVYKVVIDIGGCVEMPMRNEFRLMAIACYMHWQVGWNAPEALQERHAKTSAHEVTHLPELPTLVKRPYKMGRRVWINEGRLAGAFVCVAHHVNPDPVYLIHLDRNVTGRWYLATAEQIKAEPRTFGAPDKFDWILNHPC